MSTDFTGDWGRSARTGIAEAVLAETKSVAALSRILSETIDRGERMLFTRMTAAQFAALDAAAPGALDYDPVSRTAILGSAPANDLQSPICIVSAGTSDAPVALEAARTLALSGWQAPVVQDVGVAGLWRLMDKIEIIRRHPVIIAVAGMEGALFSVLGGLVPGLVIAVPTSVGYGVSRDGHVALHSALASCAPGIVAVNIDNGFGAACAAMKALRIQG
ncbi:MAG: nickel pincer cofactor biosynthesis protein LarB [Devosia sp.]